MKEIEEQGRKIAQQLGNDIVYNGPQYLNDEFIFHVFTDVAVTGTTFAAKTFEEAKENLIEKRKLFGAKPPSFSAKGDNPRRAITIGTCYEDAWRAIIRLEEGELVHGSVESKGKRIGHAWVELPTGFVWEPESGDFTRTSIFRDVFKPVEDARYSDLEAAMLAARLGNFGPWTQEERGKILKGGNSVPEVITPQTPLPEGNPVEEPEGNPGNYSRAIKMLREGSTIDEVVSAKVVSVSEAKQLMSSYKKILRNRHLLGLDTEQALRDAIIGDIRPPAPPARVLKPGGKPMADSQEGRNPMKPKTETERLSFHERIFGKGSTPPAERLGKGQAVNDLMPMPPESGPPLPRMLKIRWPWKK